MKNQPKSYSQACQHDEDIIATFFPRTLKKKKKGGKNQLGGVDN